MSQHDDDRLRLAYREFHREHDSLRDDLLSKLPPARALLAAAHRSKKTGAQWTAGPPRWAAGLAAALLAAIAIWLIVFRSPTPAYALDDIVSRLAGCHSVDVEGWILINGKRYPHRMYVEMPGFYWFTTLATMDDQTSMGVSASDGNRYITVSDRDKTAVTGKEIPLAAELITRMLLQMTLPDQVIGRDLRDNTKTGTEIVRGMLADRYEFPRRDGSRRVVWVDPATGLPLQSAFYEQTPDKGEEQVMAFDIVPNAARPAQGLSFEPPAGYAVVNRDRTPQSSIGVGSGTSGPESAGVILALNLEDRAILLCWTHYIRHGGNLVETDLDGAVGRLLPLRVESSDGQRRYRAHHLKSDPSDKGHHARWSLLIPQDRTLGIGNACMIIENQRMNFRCEFSPLRFEKTRLAAVVEETQKLIVAPGASPDPVFSLDELLSLEARLRQAK